MSVEEHVRARQLANANLARASRLGRTEEALAFKREFYAAQVAEAIERKLAKAPPLTPEQVRRLSELLNSAASQGD